MLPLCELAILDLALVGLAPRLIMLGLQRLPKHLIQVVIRAVLYRRVVGSHVGDLASIWVESSRLMDELLLVALASVLGPEASLDILGLVGSMLL